MSFLLDEMGLDKMGLDEMGWHHLADNARTAIREATTQLKDKISRV